jgi:SAM-dependent methyltransferase
LSVKPGAAARADRRVAMRRSMFLAQDGVALCLTLRGLEEIGALGPSLDEDRSLADLVPGLGEAGFGALRVAVHGLVATGWASGRPGLDPAHAELRWTEAGRAAMARRGAYLEIAELLAEFDGAAPDAWTRPWAPATAARFARLVEWRAADREAASPLGGDLIEGSLLVDAHLDGALLVPAVLWLHETGRLAEAAPQLPDEELGAAIASLLADLGWTDADGGWTADGEAGRAFALNFGGVATYLPLLRSLPELYRGEANVVPDPGSGGPEWHVHRALNVQISAAAHRRYFADSEPLFREIFDREPLAGQPRFIADMGCGQGSWLAYLHRLIAAETVRGRHLGEHPLLMIGVDPDPTALGEAEAALAAAGVPALLLRGDVTDPDGLREALAEHGIAIEDGLHIRSFIDHERTYRGGRNGDDRADRVPGWSSGIYLDAVGAPIDAAELERDLVAHLRRWSGHVRRHGMIVLEAHCTAPEIVARNLGAMHGLAFDAHQAYSKQYPVDHAAWLECCRLAGLRAVAQEEIRYPVHRPFVSISLSRLLSTEPAAELLPEPGPSAAIPDGPDDGWRPDPGTDLEDGEALHRIIFRGGDIRFPSPWCSAATGFVTGRGLAAVEARLDQLGRGETVAVLDYGAGTGTATIELLKAVRERGLDSRFADRGAALVVHLVDIPSSWFAKGHQLLGDQPSTRFHSLRAEAGGFRPLTDLVGPGSVDVAMVNMVFHLIPARALPRTVDGLADAVRPGGRLLWSAPDLGPAPRDTVLLHDPNRLLRELWLELLAGEHEPNGAIAEIVGRARAGRDPGSARAAQERANRRIRPRPLASEVVEALGARFDGETRTAAYEMLAEDIVAGLLVPSNQAEFMPEIADRGDREAVIRELMTTAVIPALRAGPAATGLGLDFHWVLGDHTRRA